MVEYETFEEIPSTNRVYSTGRRGGDLSNNISKFPYSRMDNVCFEVQNSGFHEMIYAPKIPGEISAISDESLVDLSVSSTNAVLIPFRASTDNINGFNISMKLSHDGYSAGKLRVALYELDMDGISSTNAQSFFATGKIIPTDEYLMDDSTSGFPWVEIDFGTTAGGNIVQSSGLHDGVNYSYVSKGIHDTLTEYASSASLPDNIPPNKPFTIELHVGSYLSNPIRDILLYHSTRSNDNVKFTSSTDGNNQYCEMGYTTITKTDAYIQNVTGKRVGKRNNLVPRSRIIPGRYYGVLIVPSENFSTTAGGTAKVSIYGSPKSLRGYRNQPYLCSAWNNRTWHGKEGIGASTTKIMSPYAFGWKMDSTFTGELPSNSNTFSSLHATNPNFFFQVFSNEKCEFKSIRISGHNGEKLTDGEVFFEIVQNYDYQRCHPIASDVSLPESFEFYDEFHNVSEKEVNDLIRMRYHDGGHDISHIHVLFQIDHKEVPTFSQTYL